MPQENFTTNDVIINSLYLLGELGVGETPDAFMLSTGLELLNELLSKFSADSIYIPYLKSVSGTFTAGKGTYSFSDMVQAPDFDVDRIVDLSMANFSIISSSGTNIVYPFRIISKMQYYGIVRQNNLQSRPSFIFLDKQAYETFITIYPLPDQPYPFTLQVKLMLDKVIAQTSLNSLPPNYYGFLKYALARKFKSYYPSGNWPPENEKEYQEYYELLKNTNETDLTIRPSVLLATDAPYYWTNILSFS